MAYATSEKQIEIKLHLSEKEARFIRNHMQNGPEDESDDSYILRQDIFECLKAELELNGSI